jgi:hypothetical protein
LCGPESDGLGDRLGHGGVYDEGGGEFAVVDLGFHRQGELGDDVGCVGAEHVPAEELPGVFVDDELERAAWVAEGDRAGAEGKVEHAKRGGGPGRCGLLEGEAHRR